MAKKLMICPFCDDSRAFAWQGVARHVKAKHPDKLKELKDNKAMYLEKFACDESGNPTEPPEPEQTPEPAPPPEPAVTPPPKETPEPPALEVTPPPKETPDKPAEGGLFHRISTGLFG